jgi:sirohydrochlorin ferrochelatase
MKALLLVAHGSRRAESNAEVGRLADELRNRAGPEFGWVGHAFLELAEPSIAQGMGQAAAAGADELLVLPYFLSAGRHVVKDIPDEVALGLREQPQLRVSVAPYLGAMPGVSDLLLETALGMTAGGG